MQSRRVVRGHVTYSLATLALVGYLAVAPFYCDARDEAGGASTTVCTSLIGISYTGTGVFNPSLLAGVYAGLLLAVLAAPLVFWLLWRLRQSHSANPLTDQPLSRTLGG
jgi:hypothetical protein